MFNENIKIRYW